MAPVMYKGKCIMKNKKEIVLNKSFFLFVILGILTLTLGYVALSEEVSLWSIFFCILGLLFVIGGPIKEPLFYSFDTDGITLHYLFVPKECYLWKNIRKIKKARDGYSRSAIIDFIFSRVYEINGKVEGKQRFYMNGIIIISFRTKRLLDKYWEIEIE